MSKIIESIKKTFYNISRKYFQMEMIGKLGEIVEKDDRIICYVKSRLMKKNSEDKFDLYRFRLPYIDPLNEENKKLDSFVLRKPICYVFENINFDRELEIVAPNCTIIFRNCVFRKNMKILLAEEAIFENNIYVARYLDKTFFYARKIKNLKFLNEDFDAKNLIPIHQTGMDIVVDTLQIENSKIKGGNNGTLLIQAKKAIIKCSELNAKEIYIDSESIDCTNSTIVSKDGVMIDNLKKDFTGTIKAPVAIYNGNELNKRNAKEIDSLRKKILEFLYQLRESCDQINNVQIQEIETKLENQTVKKVLSKNKNISG